MKGCPAFEDMSALIDGELPQEREAEVRRHLDACADCRRQIDGMTALKQSVGRAYESEGPSPALRRVVTGNLHKRRRTS